MPIDYSNGKIYKSYVKNKKGFVTSFKIIEHGNVDIILIEEYKATNRIDLHKKEREHIEKQLCVNHTIPTRTKQERLQQTPEYISRMQYRNEIEKLAQMFKDTDPDFIKAFPYLYYD
jgi:hypothetical protein